MLGRFLEWSIATADIQASLEFYATLGFSQADVGEAWQHPYAVLTDGRLCLGLHQQAAFISSVTFVRPDLLRHLDRLERLGVAFEFRRLGNDVFNEVGWYDPSGHLIRLVEARTFSPAKRPSQETSLCGYFQEIALPAANLAAAKPHWEARGFVGLEEDDAMLPHVSCTSNSINVGLYDSGQLRAATLLFEAEEIGAALSRIAAAGIEPRGVLPLPLRRGHAAMLTAPEGTPLLMRSAAPA